MRHVQLHARDLDGYLSKADLKTIAGVEKMYAGALEAFPLLQEKEPTRQRRAAQKRVLDIFAALGDSLQAALAREKRIHVYCLETPTFMHGEASRLVAKLRDQATVNPEFVYYIQRAYELLFHLAFTGVAQSRRHAIVVRTPVDVPVPNFAVHRIPQIDNLIGNSVMCVMLRAALLPSLIVSKEVQEYSSQGYLTPFALFRISRDDTRQEHDMLYRMDLKRSFFDPAQLDGRDLFFADPMNATGGSLVTVVDYLRRQGVRPRSIRFFNVVSTLKGALRIARALPEAEIYTLWMDPALNQKAYIMPGLGDAGDRINGNDSRERPRNIIHLLADYGSHVTGLYRDQVRRIEEIVLGGLEEEGR
jgi:uracil phosphoribosyltransferase